MGNRMKALRERRAAQGEKEITIWVRNQTHADKLRAIAKTMYQFIWGKTTTEAKPVEVRNDAVDPSLIQAKNLKPRKRKGQIKQ
jgi:hypothetical protein